MEDGSFSSPTQAPHADKKFLLLLGGACMLVLFFIVLAVFSFTPKQENKTITTLPTPQPEKPISNVYKIEVGKTKFSQTEYASYSYEIFPNTLSNDVKIKLKNFNFSSKPTSNESTTVTVEYLPDHSSISIIAPKNAHVYFGVKDPNGEFSDDFLILTDQNGNIIEHQL